MRIRIKNIKSLNELGQRRRERINDEVIRFLYENGYRINKLVKDPLADLINRVHKDNKTVITKTINEKLDKSPVNGLLILSFDLIIYFQDKN